MNHISLKGSGSKPLVPTYQADATLAQANPVSGTKYEILPLTKNVRLVKPPRLQVLWTGQPNPLELHLTIDGNLITFSQANPVNASSYYPLYNLHDANGAMTTDIDVAMRCWNLLEGKTVKIEGETTGGTVSDLNGRVKYQKW